MPLPVPEGGYPGIEEKWIEVRDVDGKPLLAVKGPKKAGELFERLAGWQKELPLQKYPIDDVSRFDDRCYDPSIYDDIEALIEYSEYAKVKWIKAGYLLELADRGKGTRFPRCQDIPVEAVCTMDELRTWAALRSLLAISYPWHSPAHPDPTGVSLKQICDFIKKYYASLPKDVRSMCPCFIDFCTLAQIPRTKEECKLFVRGIKNLNLVYRHEQTMVLRLNGPVPDEKDDPDHRVTNRRPYHQRGWCACEHRIAEMKQENPENSVSFHEYMAGNRSAPICMMTHVEFGKELQKLHFTCGKTDTRLVADMYETTYFASAKEYSADRIERWRFQCAQKQHEERDLESKDGVEPNVLLRVTENGQDKVIEYGDVDAMLGDAEAPTTTAVTAEVQKLSPAEWKKKFREESAKHEEDNPCEENFDYVAPPAKSTKIYVIGGIKGFGNTQTCMQVLDTDSATPTWTEGPPMTKKRGLAGSCELNGKIYIFGGTPDYNNPVDFVEVFDIESQTWSDSKRMPKARFGHRAAACNGKIYVIGGCVQRTSSLCDVDIFDPLTQEWEAGPNMPDGRTRFAIEVVNDRIYVVGGSTSRGDFHGKFADTVFILDTHKDPLEWAESREPMPTARETLGLANLDGDLYALCGAHKGNDKSALCEIYDPVKDHWTKGPSLNGGCEHCGACATEKNVYVIGGYPGGNDRKVEIFSKGHRPGEERWERGPDLPNGVWGPAVVCRLALKVILQGNLNGSALSVTKLSGEEVCQIMVAGTDEMVKVQAELERQLRETVPKFCVVLSDGRFLHKVIKEDSSITVGSYPW